MFVLNYSRDFIFMNLCSKMHNSYNVYYQFQNSSWRDLQLLTFPLCHLHSQWPQSMHIMKIHALTSFFYQLQTQSYIINIKAYVHLCIYCLASTYNTATILATIVIRCFLIICIIPFIRNPKSLK